MSKMQVAITVTFETDAERYWVSIDDQDLNFTNGQAKAHVPTDQTLLMGWWVRGTPGSKYKLDVGAEEGYEVKGPFPVEGVIPSSTKAAGFPDFSVVKAKEA